jgi:predicted nucleic acid-binding protein
MPGDTADRLIAATALLSGAAPVTADGRLQACQGLKTVW